MFRCSKDLNQWDYLLEYANDKGNTNPHLVLESAWRVPNWGLMKGALGQVELSCPKEMAWKVNLYRGYIAICHPEDAHLNMVCHYASLTTMNPFVLMQNVHLLLVNLGMLPSNIMFYMCVNNFESLLLRVVSFCFRSRG